LPIRPCFATEQKQIECLSRKTVRCLGKVRNSSWIDSCNNHLGETSSFLGKAPQQAERKGNRLSQGAGDSKKGIRSAWLLSLALVLVTCALYWPVRHFEFVEYDDPAYVFENQTVCNGLTWYGLAWSVVEAHASNWHPLTWLSHMLDCQLFGLDAGAHHLTNVLLHAASSVILFLLLRTMTGACWRSALVAALFAWHPLRVESVAWISERKDVLSGFFFMLTLWAYSNYALRKLPSEAALFQSQQLRHSVDGTSNGPRVWYFLSLGFYFLGLLSKPMLVTVPFVLLLLDYWPLARIRCDGRYPWREWRAPRGILAEKLPFFALSIALSWVTVFAQQRAMVSLRTESAGARVESMVVGYFLYLRKIFWPDNLAVLYLRPASIPVVPLVAGIVILGGISALVWVNLRRRPWLAVGWLWFLGMLVPVNGLAQTGLQSIADRYTYLPAIGLGVMASWGLGDLATAVLAGKIGRLIAATAAASALVVVAGLTRHQISYWQNTQTLMEHALALDPNNYVAHQDLGRYYTRLGRLELAAAHHQKVRELDPAFGNTYRQSHALERLNSVQAHDGAAATQ
jgi:hypothetical protein